MRPTIAAAALLFLLSSAPACADETFDLFQRFCVDTGAHGDTALAAADKAGWMPMPQAMLEKLYTELGAKTAQARILSTTAGLHLLLTIDGSVPLKHLMGRFCFVATYPSTAAQFDQQVIDFVKVPPVPNRKDAFTIYAWKEDGESHVAVGFDDKSLLDAMTHGNLRVLMTRRDDELAGLILMIPTGVDIQPPGAQGSPEATKPQ